jgi:carboxypeptidase family protein
MSSLTMSKAPSGGWCGSVVKFLAVAFGVLLLSLPAFSQGNTGRILGTVTDQSGGVIAGATVTVIDTERGVNRTLTSDDAGEYNAPNLTPGNYTVRVEAKGFKRLDRQGVVLEVGKELRVDLTVQPGQQEQTVTVTESVPLVDTTTATLGGTLENSEIVDLPLNGRDYQNLLSLRPGVMTQVGGGPWTQSTNGVRPDQSVWMIDGVINSNFFDARPIAGMPSPITDGATILPIDSIQEFNLMENPKAEYGWKPGAVVNVGIKSGTNDFHGTVYGFYRSSNWDARNYFNFAPESSGTCILGPPANGISPCAKPPAQLKQYGASVGGPIIKDKLFFFANYEGLNDAIGNSFGTTGGSGVPETVAGGGAAVSMVDALNAAAGCAGGGACNAAVISPESLALTGCTLGTTAAATACTGGFFPNGQTTTGYLSTIPNVNNSYNGVSKIDYHVNEKNSINGDFIIGRYAGDGEDRGFIDKIFSNGYIINTWTASGNWDYTPNSSIVNEVRFGYNRMTFDTTSDDATLKDPINTGSTLPGFPTISIGNPASASGSPFGLFGTWHNRPQSISPNPYWDAIDDLSYLAGKHALKFGGEFAHIEADSDIPDYGRGRINFSSLQNFFAGNPKGGQYFVGNANRRMLWTNTAAFVQDDWRIAPKFTLNLGLRYEFKSPIRDSQNLWANFDPNSPTGLVQQGSPGHNTLWNPDRGDFSPRVGFAWDLNGKGTTVVRGGFSIIYESFTAVEWMNQNQFQNDSSVSLAANPTGACTVPVPLGSTCALAGGSTLGGNIVVKAAKFPASQMCYDPAVSACPAGQSTVFPANAVISCTSNSPCDLMGVDPNLKTPYVENFSLGVTHSFNNNLSLEVGYVGNHGARLTGFANINQCPANPTTLVGGNPTNSCVGPYDSKFPGFGAINYMTNDVRSNYNSVQATLTKRMSHGVSFVAGYTFAHGLDSGSLNRFALLPQNDANPGAEYGNSDFDVRHRLTITGTYNIPGIKGFGQAFEGWQINAIATIQSSQPWTVNDYNAGPYPDFPLGFSGTDRFDGGGGHGTDRWDFFGNPSDFQGTANSIPFCSGFGTAAGPSCTITNGISNATSTPSNSAALIANCLKFAPDPSTLADGGCFARGNSVMTPPVNGTFGTMGRNIFRDSGFKNLDFSVFKNFKFKERYNAQFRAEIFNILNHPIPENPYGASNGSSGGNNDPSSASGFGGATGTPDVVAGNPLVGSGDARAIQVGLKLTF